VKALVGGTLIDGYGSTPLRNSVVIIQGERIKAVGQVGTLAIPSGAEVVSTEGMSVLPGLWDMHVHLMINGHSDYAHWDKTYPPQMESVIMWTTESQPVGPRSYSQRRDTWSNALRVGAVYSTRALSRH
jgi:imidazolonepropionase-like amidohydrolase